MPYKHPICSVYLIQYCSRSTHGMVFLKLPRNWNIVISNISQMQYWSQSHERKNYQDGDERSEDRGILNIQYAAHIKPKTAGNIKHKSCCFNKLTTVMWLFWNSYRFSSHITHKDRIYKYLCTSCIKCLALIPTVHNTPPDLMLPCTHALSPTHHSHACRCPYQ